MSPRARRGGTSSRKTPRRRGRTAVAVLGAVALLVVGVLAGVGAVLFGLVPGFHVRRTSDRPPTDSVALVDSAATAPVPAVALPDSITTTTATPRPADSLAAPATAGVVTAADSAAGEVVYRGAGRCLSCHGATGEGVAQLGPSLRDATWLVGDGSVGAIERAVRDGVSPPKQFPIAMPAYGRQLPEEAIARVSAYVYAISHAGAVQRDSLAPRPDSAKVPPEPR